MSIFDKLVSKPDSKTLWEDSSKDDIQKLPFFSLLVSGQISKRCNSCYYDDLENRRENGLVMIGGRKKGSQTAATTDKCWQGWGSEKCENVSGISAK